MEIEAFNCICGKNFGSMVELQEHWKTNTSQTTGRPHYRLITGGAMHELDRKTAREMPSDLRTTWTTSSQIIEEALIEAEPAAEWLRKHPPGARLPEQLEPGYEPDEYVPESKGTDEDGE